MKNRIYFFLLAVAIAVLPLVSAANVNVTNNVPGTVRYVTVGHEIWCDESYYTSFSCEHFLQYGESVVFMDGPEGGCYHEYHVWGDITVPINTAGDNIPTEVDAVDGSPSVTREAFEAALQGGSTYCYIFNKSILAAVNPQTYADALGAIVGFVVNIADPGTRPQVVADIQADIASLAVTQTWKDAAAHAASPTGLAEMTSNAVLIVVPTKFGTVKVADNIPPNVASRVAQRIGATGVYGEARLQALFGNNRHVYKATSKGARFIDNLGADNIAREAKAGYTKLTEFVKRQIQKDVELRDTGQVSGVEWRFYDSEVTGLGGPSGPLKAYLDAKGIPVYYNDVLLPPGPWTKS